MRSRIDVLEISQHLLRRCTLRGIDLQEPPDNLLLERLVERRG
jgi:hypothetical protein